VNVEEQARSLNNFDIAVTFVTQYRTIEQRNKELQSQLDWLKRQVFGEKSEKRFDIPASQLALGELGEVTKEAVTETQVASHSRKQSTPKEEAEVVRFDESVPTETIVLLPPEVKDLVEGQDYEVIGVKETVRLAQLPAAYVILRYVRPVIKLLDQLLAVPAPPPVLPQSRSIADVSLLAGLVVDKFQFHLPLYRQHQRMKAAGINLSRSLLTNLVQDTAELLAPLYRALERSVLDSRILMVDETPIKAGVEHGEHRMKKGWFWPVYGEKDEIVFIFRESRGKKEIDKILSHWNPPDQGNPERILLTDGLEAYASYAEKTESLTHAQCWVHTRRNFIEAAEVEPELTTELLELIGALYAVEAECNQLEDPSKILQQRGLRSRPLVELIFERLRQLSTSRVMLGDTLFTKAVNYALRRETQLKVFLEEPLLPMDTNALERQIRPIPLGRKNWLFCWTEIGAIYTGIIQSLICSCKLQGVNPFTYLVDVMLRLSSQPDTDLNSLIPRQWKLLHQDNPWRSDLVRNHAAR